jgi:SlyX protein
MTDARINELEVKLSFAEDLVHTLEKQVTKQELRLLEMEQRLRLVSQTLNSLQSGSTDAGKIELPPHY